MYLIDYVRAVKRIPFSLEPLNEVDMCAFATIPYLALDGIVSDRMQGAERSVTEAARLYAAAHDRKTDGLGLFTPAEFLDVLQEMGGSVRYGDLQLFGYRREWDADSEKQFNAIGIRLPWNEMVLSIAGTDDSLIGWKEDLNLACHTNVAGQFSAVRFVNDALRERTEDFSMCGYSKGGNFAVYSAAMCDAPERLQRLYDFDGPGFPKAFLNDRRFAAISSRCLLIAPRYSAVSMMLFNLPQYVVTRGALRGLLQHDCSRWEIADVRFVREPELSEESFRFHEGIVRLLEDTTPKERQIAIDNGFLIAEQTGLLTLTELNGNRTAAMQRMLHAFRRLDPATRKTTTALFVRFIRLLAENYTGKR